MDEDTEQAINRLFSAAVGNRLPIRVQAQGYAPQAHGSILGSVPGRYAILRSPATDNSGKTLSSLSPRIGDRLIVRLFVEGVAYGFTSPVMMVLSQPEPLVFVRYPDVVEQVNVRQDQRFICRLPCTLKDPSGEPIPALLLDISAHGCKVVCGALEQERHEPGSTVRLELALPPPMGVQEVAGNIVRITEQRHGVALGMEFDDERRELAARVADYLSLDDD